MNLDTLTFIKSKQIFNIEGQEALYNSGVATIQFPAGAKEIKAQWREISAADETRYHSCQFNGKLYGLTAPVTAHPQRVLDNGRGLIDTGIPG
jgi:hypothetical protein